MVQGLTNLKLFHQFDFAWPPGLVEPGLKRTLHTQDDEPALVGHRLQPVVLLARGRFRREVNIVGTVGVLLYTFRLAANCWE